MSESTSNVSTSPFKLDDRSGTSVVASSLHIYSLYIAPRRSVLATIEEKDARKMSRIS